MAWVEKDWTRALQLYRELLADHPGGVAVAEGHLGMARALEGMGISGEEVAVAYEAATRLSLQDEGRGDALMKAAQHRLADGQEAQAAELFRQVIAENRDAVAPAHLALGRLLLAQGSVDEALEHFQILSTSADPQVGALGRFGISISYERLGDLDSAIAELDEEEASVSSRDSRGFLRDVLRSQGKAVVQRNSTFQKSYLIPFNPQQIESAGAEDRNGLRILGTPTVDVSLTPC